MSVSFYCILIIIRVEKNVITSELCVRRCVPLGWRLMFWKNKASANVINVRRQMCITLIFNGMLNMLCDGVVHIDLNK